MDKESGNGKIYIITSGEYSDYCVHGYCTTEEAAREWCAAHNSREYADNHLWSTYYEYEEIERMELDDHPVILHLFCVNFYWNIPAHAWVAKYGPKKQALVTQHVSKAIRVKDRCHTVYKTVVTVREDSEELALKAAQDILYRQIALDIESGEVFS